MSELDFTVKRYGTDTSGRPIRFTVAMWQAWQGVLADPRVAPFAGKVTIVQSSFMAGAGAAASAGYHDKAGAGDVRTWNLTTAELDTLVRVAREQGIALWRRDATHGGMDPHAHWAAGWDSPVASGIAFQWTEYQANRDGLASRGRDYEWRPSPLVLTPPTKEADTMAVEKKIDRLTAMFKRFRKGELARDKAARVKAQRVASRQIAMLGGVVDTLTELADTDDVTVLKRRIAALRSTVLEHLADDPDVDGVDNPAARTDTQEA